MINGMNRNLVTTFIGVDLAENEPDYTSLGVIDSKNKTIESRIIRTDNPKPDYFFKQFIENEQEKEKEPSDENGRGSYLRNAEEDNCV